MNEGRAELQRVILQYEKQRAEAIRSKQEAEIVLPFVRAALEELDAALGQSENNADDQRAHAKRAVERSAAAAKERASAKPETFEDDRHQTGSSVFGVTEDEDGDEVEQPAARSAGFNRSSIASLLDDAKKQQRTG